MGIYIRKSISVGPIRFNLSKSGIGVSAGIKGLRLGTGPRGNYIHIGRGGLYYRATLPPSPSSQLRQNDQPPIPAEHSIPDGTHAPLKEIDSACASQIVDSSSQELLDELNQKKKHTHLWPFVAIICLALILLGHSASWPAWSLAAILAIGISAAYVTSSRDTLATTTVLFYNLEHEIEDAYTKLHSAAEKLSICSSIWHIEAEGQVYDKKYHAGASSLIRRKKSFIRKAAPPRLKTNIDTISAGVGAQTLYFFPDRILIYDSNGVGAVSYKNLSIQTKHSRFIEDGSVPHDAEIVDKTWQYVNKKGGPDRRFKNNKQLPICLYDEMHLTSQSGLNEILQLSKHGIVRDFVEAIEFISQISPLEIASTMSANSTE